MNRGGFRGGYRGRLGELYPQVTNPQVACVILFFKLMMAISIILPVKITSRLMSRDNPRVYLHDIHVSSLNNTFRSSTNTTTIYFDLKIHNPNSGVGIYYDPANLTFTYFPPTVTTNTNVTIGEYTIQGFYQGNGKTKHVHDFVQVQDLFSEDTHRKELGKTSVSLTGPFKVVVFRVDLVAKIKFKSIENQKSKVVVGIFFEVNGDTGNLVQKRITEGKYGSYPSSFGLLQLLLFLILLVLLLASSCTVFVGLPYIAFGAANDQRRS